MDDTWYLVDLPGFGYAKVSKKDRVKWMKVTKQYLNSRTNLMCVMMLVDSRIPAQKSRPRIHGLDGGSGVAVLVFTKVDKLNKAERAAFLPAYEQVILKQWHKMPPVFVTSGNTGEGTRRGASLHRLHQWAVSALRLRIQSRQCAWRALPVNPRSAFAWSLSEVERS